MEFLYELGSNFSKILSSVHCCAKTLHRVVCLDAIGIFCPIAEFCELWAY